ncbi:hypothetical protein KIL84_018439 [Mauremys mutica]|uniref:PH domain-containing protein n=1 Tax=Mauremys mutica TaxID=74926 RepID=A0A9D3XUT1_9SAUR|nr:hypothetical protein KIL84_018439 [Mauremys mutica]
MALMKSGWLWRQSSILRRWKRNWFVLWLDGGLVYYQDETQRDLEGRIHIKFNCRDIKTGRECRGGDHVAERLPSLLGWGRLVGSNQESQQAKPSG